MVRLLGAVGVGLAALTLSGSAEAQSCNSDNPADWPDPSRPYFMLAVDTSGSMTACTTPPSVYPTECNTSAPGYQVNSCGMVPSRLNDAKCALRKTVQAFAGQVNFGVATFATVMLNCPAGTCNSACSPFNGGNCSSESYGCSQACFTEEITTTGQCAGCGPRPGGIAANRAGANIRVPMQLDDFWSSPRTPSNVPSVLSWFDNVCTGGEELAAFGNTPLNGMLRDMYRYFSSSWTSPGGGVTYSTPLNVQDRPGAGVNGSTACRNVNVILLTDGDETCDTDASAVAAATALYSTGVTVGGKTFKIRTHVINFAGGTQSKTDAIAAAGGTGASLFATNEATLSVALSTIISSAIRPEVCNNTDDNCNGCIDEGYTHYCNTRSDCCSGPRATCLAQYAASVAAGSPDVTRIPCVTSAQADNPLLGLCPNAGEQCNGVDDNCNGETDEGFGNPVCCPVPETCNGVDDNCDGIVDNAPGSSVPFSLPGCTQCVPSAEICDGCDNDCDGLVDEGIAPIACGFSPPANCAGTQTCSPGGSVTPGGCLPGHPASRLSACSSSPSTEVCDGIDNDCDGQVDEGIAPVACDVPGRPGLVYGGNSQCRRGTQACNGVCTGFVGPSTEICDGIDNDCDGLVDEGVLPGTGNECGTDAGQCQKGTTACVGGVLVCAGGTPPSPEVCDGIDNDCNGITDDAPLLDAPTDSACWGTDPAGCAPNPACAHQGLAWCAPPGATCKGTGSLTSPCQTGTLLCDGARGWICQGGTAPSPEVCDGADNDCNGSADDALGAPVGDACGSNVGQCQPGVLACNAGTLTCQGGVAPTTELCNGLDDDCDGTIDNGIPLGDSCAAPYDTNQFPGVRDFGACRPGVLSCDIGGSGTLVCNGGIGPQPEICDGIDNDCDGLIDEAGPAPDGIDGTASPSDPSLIIGAPCGSDVGQCTPGRLACVSGNVVCSGGVGPQPEVCDCLDNDCDGQVDEDAAADEEALCAPGRTCVEAAADNCQCAAPCGSGEFKCPTSFECKQLDRSGTGEPAGSFCVVDNCGDCSTKTAAYPDGAIACGPEGTPDVGGRPVPLCECKGTSGCSGPCFGIACGDGQRCVPYGRFAGECRPDTNCNFFGCQSGRACHNDVCVDDPCDPNPCQQDEVCKPTISFTDFRCTPSCAGVDCQAGERCVDGACTPTGCDEPCQEGEVCKANGDGSFACGPNACANPFCDDGKWCNPATGACGDDPCSGVLCPDSQRCVLGECFAGSGGSGGSSGSGGAAGAGGNAGSSSGATGGSAGSGGTAGSRTDEPARGVWGLPTGGGGCACSTPAPSPGRYGWAGALLFAGWWLRRRRVTSRR
ncbi:MAG: hypothetical protein KIT72_19480 [Polyangiaceae bacterium]|nr:hypothetical protein [Polyangiaceae bacterium]MCW5792603.1 hypothetical protein [Polyangiaceae bacterium]